MNVLTRIDAIVFVLASAIGFGFLSGAIHVGPPSDGPSSTDAAITVHSITHTPHN